MGQMSIPFSRGQKTSFEAAVSIRPHLQELEARVLNFIQSRGDFGATCDEAEVRLKLSHQSTSARVRGLFLKGEIQDSKRRRLTRSGRKAIVWLAR